MERLEETLILMDAITNGVAGAVERQEARGQQDLCNSQKTSLSTEMRCSFKSPNEDPHKVLASWGVDVGKPVEGDDMFTECRLPDGWILKPTDHSMWNKLLDDKGRERGSMFYKAAFYDRSTHLDLLPRFSTRPYGTKNGKSFCRVLDGGEGAVFESKPYSYPNIYDDNDAYYALPSEKRSEVYDAHNDARRLACTECEEWLEANYPDWKDETKYWDVKEQSC